MINFFGLWLTEPLSLKSSFRLWLVFTVLVFTVWILTPILLGVHFQVHYFAIKLSLRNFFTTMSGSFGEEFVFRVLPIATVLYVFPGKTAWAFLAGLGVAYPFGMWHEWILTSKTCLGLGGIILTLAYLKFGGVSGKPFHGLIACGSIHTVCNTAVAVIANIADSW
jgi:hypothetical protein